MKNTSKLIAAACVLTASLATTASFAQATASATATGTIVTPISITEDVNMNFGNLAVQTATGGTVVLAPDGSRTVTLGVSLPVTAGTVTAASFTVTGEAGYTYAITLPVTDVTLNSGIYTMTANTFTSTPLTAGLLTAGIQTLTVGATLNVAAAQPAGVYITQTPFDVTVNYN